MTRLVLHAGSHKTGTSAIQTFAMTHRDALAERGWLYPDLAPFSEERKMPHIIFAHALARKRAEVLTARDALRLPRRWARAAAAAGASVFLSAEPFYRHVLPHPGPRDWFSGRRAYLQRLATALAPFDVEPVLVFRRPDDFVRALYQENVSRDARPRWTSFTAFHRDGRNSMLRFAENAELLAEVFPKTRVLIYEDLAAGDFCANFFGALGIDVAGLAEPGRIRPGLSAVNVAAKLALAELEDRERSNVELSKLVRSPRIQAILARHLGPGPFGFWTDAGERARLLETRSENTERLRRRFLPERETLFPPPPADEPPPVPPFSDALRRALAAAAAKPPGRSAAKVAAAVDRARRALGGAAS